MFNSKTLSGPRFFWYRKDSSENCSVEYSICTYATIKFCWKNFSFLTTNDLCWKLFHQPFIRTSVTVWTGKSPDTCKISPSICPRSSDPFYALTYYIKWVTTSWTYGTTLSKCKGYGPMNRIRIQKPYQGKLRDLQGGQLWLQAEGQMSQHYRLQIRMGDMNYERWIETIK